MSGVADDVYSWEHSHGNRSYRVSAKPVRPLFSSIGAVKLSECHSPGHHHGHHYPHSNRCQPSGWQQMCSLLKCCRRDGVWMPHGSTSRRTIHPPTLELSCGFCTLLCYS